MLLLRWYLWVAPNILAFVCSVILIQRKLFKIFPAFTAYLIFESVQFVLMVIADLLIMASILSLPVFRWMLVIGDGVGATIQLFILYELAKRLLLSRTTARIFRPWSRAISATLLLGAAFCAAFLPQKGLERVVAVIQIFEFSIGLITVGLLIALLFFTRVLHISWRSLSAGVALGFGIVCCAELISSPLLPAAAAYRFIPTDLFRLSADHIAAVIWLAYILMPEGLPRYTGTGISKADFDSWQQQLEGVVRK
jgi:hypothetical protein